jgi:ferredoxin-NADP reductase
MPLKLPCEVAEIQDHGEHVYSVFLRPETAAPRFRPGQFLHLALDPYEHGDFWPDSRVFSIASPATDRSMLRITYSVKGKFTARMESDLQAGKPVWVKMPYGDFTIDEPNVCLLAGGTGITAFTSFLSQITAPYPGSLSLFYGARRPDLLIYRPLVEQAQERCPAFKAYFFAEEDPGEFCLAAHPDPDFILNTIAAPFSTTFYLSGPPAMLAYHRQELGQRGIPQDHLRVDAWE